MYGMTDSSVRQPGVTREGFTHVAATRPDVVRAPVATTPVAARRFEVALAHQGVAMSCGVPLAQFASPAGARVPFPSADALEAVRRANAPVECPSFKGRPRITASWPLNVLGPESTFDRASRAVYGIGCPPGTLAVGGCLDGPLGSALVAALALPPRRPPSQAAIDGALAYIAGVRLFYPLTIAAWETVDPPTRPDFAPAHATHERITDGTPKEVVIALARAFS